MTYVFELYLVYLNFEGMEVRSTMPIFTSLADCDWWRDYLTQIFTTFHGATMKYSSCTELPR
jgi:hypothetical protein